ncbi:N-acetyltransferase [Rhizocola hellebori]|uniref:N-acetyltransferase n=1 Tax=Rhizocola hellebori TaxID=1392758 RepID=A0A8J3QIC4_9ACTN|nr:GNAT family N-acetyltransferase [Rhizocola hellebori]GIH10192.1 N-acetyltransferase [Rhizocola hellebori]
MMIRPAEASDAASVADIWYRGWQDGHLGHVPEELVRIRTAESFTVRAAQRVQETTVAVVDGEVAGFIMVAGDEVEQVYVDAKHRGSGVAADLLAEAARQVKAKGHQRAWLAVATGNARARRFYERQGWADEGPFDYAAHTETGTTAVPCHRYVKRLA